MVENNLRCKHRHLESEHPNCFRNITEETSPRFWYELENLRIGYFDIETDGLDADFGTLLTWAIKERGKDNYYTGKIKQADLFSDVLDRNLVRDCINNLFQFDIIVTYYGTGFDIPFMRSKALHYELPFPTYSLQEIKLKNGTIKSNMKTEMYHFDLYYAVKSKLRLSRSSLDSACSYLGISGKTPLDKRTWARAKYGREAEVLEVMKHNLGDVDILEKLHDRIEMVQKWSRKPF